MREALELYTCCDSLVMPRWTPYPRADPSLHCAAVLDYFDLHILNRWRARRGEHMRGRRRGGAQMAGNGGTR